MANYSLTTHTTAVSTLSGVMTLLETQLETVDTTKTIHYIDVIKVGDNQFRGVLIYNT